MTVSFSDLGLAEPLLRALAEEGYESPTPIQAGAIPVMLTGADLLGIAQTGTGKTASFVLPILHRLATLGREAGPPAPGTCRALILAPTRELATQIAQNVRGYGRFLRPRAAVVVGGVSPGPQIQALARGQDLVIATPGRLEDHIRNRVLSLKAVETVVLDEADQMLDLGFIPAIRRLLGQMPRGRQTVLFSATMPPAIRDLASAFLSHPKEVAVAPASKPIDRIEQSVIALDAGAKRDALVALLAPAAVERAIVFTRTKHGADKVTKHLEAYGIQAVVIHGNKSQSQRDRALGAFKAGLARVLVATDIAARGIDIDQVSHVINYELPDVPEAYVHRIGRTARAGRSGIAVAFCAPDERSNLRDIERLIGRKLPPAPVPAMPEGMVMRAPAAHAPAEPRWDPVEGQGGGERGGRDGGPGRGKPRGAVGAAKADARGERGHGQGYGPGAGKAHGKGPGGGAGAPGKGKPKRRPYPGQGGQGPTNGYGQSAQGQGAHGQGAYGQGGGERSAEAQVAGGRSSGEHGRTRAA